MSALCTIFLILVTLLFLRQTPALAHGPDRPPHQIADLGEFVLEGGGVIKNLRMSYVTWGTLATAKDNAILFMHGFAANHHLADHLIGSGKPFDTDRYFVICTDSLGSTQTGFEHSTSPTSSGLKMEFPAYNIRDMIQAEHKVLTEGLGIEHLVAVAGISSGATKSLQFAVSYPEFVDGVIPIVGGALDSTEGFLFGLQIESRIETCEGWQAGNYEVNPRECAAATLWPLFHTLYSREWWNGNIRTREAFQRWSEYWYSTYVGVQDARDLYLHSKALGRAGLADTPGFNGDLMAVLKSIRAKTLFVVSSADTWVPPEGVEIQRKAIPGSRVAAIDSSAGHMICCGEDAEATWLLIWNDLSRRTSRGLVRGPSTSRGRRRAQLAAARVAGPGTRLTVDARDMAHTRPGLKRHRRRLITLIFADRALSSPSWS